MSHRPHAATLGGLLAARRRWEGSGLLAAIGLLGIAGGLGAWIGLDLGQGQAAATVGRLFYLCLALLAPAPIGALGALYHEALHARLLPFPLLGGAHLQLGLRVFARRYLPWAVLAAGLGVGAGWHAGAGVQLVLAGFCLVVYLGGWGIAAGFAGLCAALSDTDHPVVARLRQGAVGPFGSPRHAPYFYLPALAFAGAAVVASAAEVGARDLLRVWDASSLLLLLSPIGAAGGALVIGGLAYRTCALRAIPRVVEEARSVYGGRPAPEDPPYGSWLGRLLPRAVAPHYGKALRELVRSHRALWPLIVLGLLLTGAYAANVGNPLGAAPALAAVLVVAVGSLPLGIGPRQCGAAMALTLPVAPAAAWAGRWAALLFVAIHLVVPVALTVGLRHGRELGAVAGMLLLATSALATSVTAPGAQQRLEGRDWGRRARLVPAAALIGGLGALSWPGPGMIVLAALTLAAPFLPRAPLRGARR